MTIESITQQQMLIDLSASFPALVKRPLAEFGADYAGKDGFWVTEQGQPMMPDSDESLFNWSGGAVDDPTYNGFMHTGFEAWLQARGWAWDCYDIGTIFLVPEAYFAEPAA